MGISDGKTSQVFVTDLIKDIVDNFTLKKLTTLPEFINSTDFKKRWQSFRRGAIYVFNKYQSLPVYDEAIDTLLAWDLLEDCYIGRFDLNYLNSALFRYRDYYIHTIEFEASFDYFFVALFPVAN